MNEEWDMVESDGDTIHVQWLDCVQAGDGRMGMNNLKTRVHEQVSH